MLLFGECVRRKKSSQLSAWLSFLILDRLWSKGFFLRLTFQIWAPPRYQSPTQGQGVNMEPQESSTDECEGDLAVTSLTPLITRVDSADLASQEGVPFLPHHSTCVPPEAACSVEEDHSLVKGIRVSALHCQNLQTNS